MNKFWFLNKIINPFVVFLLQSPLHALLDSNLILINYVGRRTGKTRIFPVQFAMDGQELIVIPAQHDKKNWWRNLSNKQIVKVLLKGKWKEYSVKIFAENEEGKANKLVRYLRHYPLLARQVRNSSGNLSHQ